MQTWLANGLQVRIEDAKWWITLWGAAHDLGKIIPDFQLQAAQHNERLIPALESAGFECQQGTHSSSVPHGQITAVTLAQILDVRSANGRLLPQFRLRGGQNFRPSLKGSRSARIAVAQNQHLVLASENLDRQSLRYKAIELPS